MSKVVSIRTNKQGVGGEPRSNASDVLAGLVRAYTAYADTCVQCGVSGAPASWVEFFGSGLCHAYLQAGGVSCVEHVGGRLVSASGAVARSCVGVADVDTGGSVDDTGGDLRGAGVSVCSVEDSSADVLSTDGVVVGGGDAESVGSESHLTGLVGRARRKKKRALAAGSSKELVEEVPESVENDVVTGFALEVTAEKKKKKSGAAQRKARKGADCGGSKVDNGPKVVEDAGVGVESANWRVRSPRAPVHVGYFSTVPKSVQDELKATRAQVLIAENKARIRRMEADAKMDVMARAAELKRLKMDKQLKAEYDHKYGDGTSGFAETVVSAGLQDTIIVPSVSTGSGSVSPNSSISMAEVRKMEVLIERLTQETSELRAKLSALSSIGTEDLGREDDAVGASRVTLLQAHREFYDGLDEAYEQLDAQDRKPPSLFSEAEYLRRLDAGGKKTEGYVFGKGGPSIVGY